MLPDGVDYIGEYAFCECSALKAFSIPSGVSQIEVDTFAGCAGLTEIEIPEGVWSIDHGAFAACSGLTRVTVGENVAYIGVCAFGPWTSASNVDARHLGDSCSSLSTMIFLGDAPTVENQWTDNDSIRNVAPDFCAYVKFGSYGWGSQIPGTWKGLKIAYIQDSVRMVVFHPEGGVMSGAAERIYQPGQAIGELPIVAREGFMFLGWYTARGVKITPDAHVTTDLSLYANWQEYSGGMVSDSITVTVTNVVVHYIMPGVPSSSVTPPETTGIVNVITEVKPGTAIAIGAEWASQYAAFASRFGSDLSRALVAQTGKRDGAGNPMMVWQDYVAGTDPTKQGDVFSATITFDNETGNPIISWTPVLSAAEAAKREYRLFGKIRLQDTEWVEISGADAAKYNFFKVTVEMR